MTVLPGDPTDPFPTTVSAGVTLVAIFGACLIGSTGAIRIAPLLMETAGLTLYAVGMWFRRRGHRLAGRSATAVGLLIAGGGLLGAVVLAPPLPTLLPLLACGLGALSVTLGVFPVSVRVARPLSTVGIALVFVGVTATTVVGTPSLWRSTVAVTLVFLSWDASERAIALGNRVGDTAETVAVELTGLAASVVVAAVAIALTLAAARVPITGPSIIGLAFLLVSSVFCLLALTHVPQSVDAD
ncbi:DUF7519 family protein [Haloterrigena salifodinae]|uniref:DUF7519 family protein n=1 Tax=Haloterrigena salifodinae TaxID=2675099 RepID=UPI000F85D0B7|nr:hypothetical protein [Haloterrigena salifodinae]